MALTPCSYILGHYRDNSEISTVRQLVDFILKDPCTYNSELYLESFFAFDDNIDIIFLLEMESGLLTNACQRIWMQMQMFHLIQMEM